MKQINKKNLATLSVLAVAAVTMFAPELALAATGGKESNITGFIGDQIFKDAITLGFGIFAFVKWIDYIAGFEPGSALKGLIVPGVATFMAFKWTMVLGWFNLVK